MPTHLTAHLTAHPSLDAREEQQVRKLAHSVYASADWIVHAKMIARSWDGLSHGWATRLQQETRVDESAPQRPQLSLVRRGGRRNSVAGCAAAVGVPRPRAAYCG